MTPDLLAYLTDELKVSSLKLLGMGAFAEVYSGEREEKRQAFKISLKPLDPKLRKLADEELQLMKREAVTGCDFIVQLLGAHWFDGHFITRWELGQQSLSDRLKRYADEGRQGLPLEELRSYLQDAASGIDVVNALGHKHRDIKPDNLLVFHNTHAKHGRVKVADFGLTVFTGASTMSMTGSGTPGYLPSEAYGTNQNPHGQIHSTIDIYSLAATAIELATGQKPFGQGWVEIVDAQRASLPVTTGLTAQQTSAVIAALQFDPKQRSFKTAMEFYNAFFAEPSPQRREAERTVPEPPLASRQPTESPREAAPRRPGDLQIIKVNGIDTRWHWIPAGKFKMGSPSSEGGRHDDENQVDVTISKGYWMLETPVTQELWTAVMKTTLSWTSIYYGLSPKHPAYGMSYDEAADFCAKFNALLKSDSRAAGMSVSLPTEAQWEYAGRAGTTTRYYWGDDEARLDEYAWHDGNSKGATQPVGQKKPNAWGLKDMSGNVWEWCTDWYADTLAGGIDPRGPSSASSRVSRGGSWYSSVGDGFLRSAVRIRFSPGFRNDNLGFRLLCSSVGG